MTLEEFLEKYGYCSLGLIVGEYIARAPAFPGDGPLIAEINAALANLESALRAAARE